MLKYAIRLTSCAADIYIYLVLMAPHSNRLAVTVRIGHYGLIQKSMVRITLQLNQV